MIIGNVLPEVGEMIPRAQRPSRGEDVAREVWRRVWRNRNLKITVADHVEKYSAANGFVRFIFRQLTGKMPAAVNSIGVAEVFDSFLTIEEHELNFLGEFRLQCQDSSHFQK